MKDKTYYILVDGKPVRVRAEKKPNKKLIEAITRMVKLVYEKETRR